MIKQRITQLVEFKQLKKEEFYPKIGATPANFRGDAAKTPVKSDTIAKLFAEIPEVNLEWLISGEGEMIKSESINSSEIEPLGKALKYLADIKVMISAAEQTDAAFAQKFDILSKLIVGAMNEQSALKNNVDNILSALSRIESKVEHTH